MIYAVLRQYRHARASGHPALARFSLDSAFAGMTPSIELTVAEVSRTVVLAARALASRAGLRYQYKLFVPEWWNGRRAGLKIRWGQPREGSSPSSGTK